MPLKLCATDKDYAEKWDQLLNKERAEATDVADVVSKIIEDVRHNGDAALIELTKKFDSIDLTEKGFRVSLEEIRDARGSVSKEEFSALTLAADRIESFHANQKPKDLSYTDEQGVRLGLRWSALDAVGLYVPGGTASYPSSVPVSYTHLTLPTNREV